MDSGLRYSGLLYTYIIHKHFSSKTTLQIHTVRKKAEKKAFNQDEFVEDERRKRHKSQDSYES